MDTYFVYLLALTNNLITITISFLETQSTQVSRYGGVSFDKSVRFSINLTPCSIRSAARMESTGQSGRIHISAETAEELRMGGKGSWIGQREDKVIAKGKGEMQTFWLVEQKKPVASVHSDSSKPTDHTTADDASDSNPDPLLGSSHVRRGISPEANNGSTAKKTLPPKLQRLVKWNADVLVRLLKQIVARRNSIQSLIKAPNVHPRQQTASCSRSGPANGTVIDEVVEVVHLPRFDGRAARNQQDPKTVELEKEVVDQLHNYVTVIASLYRADVPFHNVSIIISISS
jgi:Adenylate and Guanylate cyclase catalytic domain